MKANKQLILNKHLSGVDIGDSNDAILKAMDEYASSLQSNTEREENRYKCGECGQIQTREEMRREYGDGFDQLLCNTCNNEVLIDQLHEVISCEVIPTQTNKGAEENVRKFLESKGIDCEDIVAYSTPRGVEPPIDIDIIGLLQEYSSQTEVTNNAEEFYRSLYPKVKELNYSDKLVIEILEKFASQHPKVSDEEIEILAIKIVEMFDCMNPLTEEAVKVNDVTKMLKAKWLQSLTPSNTKVTEENSLREIFNELINAGRDMERRDRLQQTYLSEDMYFVDFKRRFDLTPSNTKELKTK